MFKKLAFLLLASILLLTGVACTRSDESKNPAPTPAPQQTENNTPPPTEPDEGKKNPVVTIEMTNGKIIKMELYPKVAPNTVNNFISLVKKGFYDNTTFHRVIPDFMIQGGDPEGTGRGGPGYTIRGEFNSNNFTNNLKHTRGVISMARMGQPGPNDTPDTAGSQFFIMVADSPYLDGIYAAFGKVIEGMEVADEIVSVKRDANNKPLEEQKMKKVTVETFGINYPEPEVIK